MARVSVLIPTYNRQEYIGEAIRSIQSQTYEDCEIVVVDDGSTDDTEQVVKRFGDDIRYIYQQNQGVSTARNLAFRKSTGEYVVFLDSDDYLLPNALGNLAHALDDSPTSDIVYSNGYIVDTDGVHQATLSDYSPRPFVDALETFVVGNPLGLHGTMFRRSALERIDGPFDPQMLGYEDWDMIMRLKANGCTFHFLAAYTACYRFHGGNKSAPKSALSEKRRLSLWRNRQKVMDAPWFDSLSLQGKQTFFQDLMVGTLQGDRLRQEQVLSHRAFQALPAKVRSSLLYRFAIDNILNGNVQPQDRGSFSKSIRLDPRNLRAYLALGLVSLNPRIAQKTLSRWRKVRAGSAPSDPVTQILRSKNVA